MSSNPISDVSVSHHVVAPAGTGQEKEYVNKPILAVNMRIIRKVAAYIMLTGVYSFTYLIALLGSIIPHRQWKPTGRILVTGTFHNPGWYLSHISPLAHSGVKEIILVVDEPQLPLEKVKFVCPPRWISRLLSRACAKAIWMIIAGLRYRPDLYMGYHLAPGACSALMVGKLLGRPSCYQMTGGPVELIGSGFNTIASFDKNFKQPAKVIESMAIGVIRQFDLIVVRGSKAKEFLARRGIKKAVAVVTGSVNGCTQPIKSNREIDLIFVGRLCPIKQVHQLVAVVHAIRSIIPNVQVAIVGDGPLMASLRAYVEQLGLADNIKFFGKREDVEAILVCSKIFVLTSKSEGLSIAMAEAMTAGTVPVVADVGELGDLVIDGVNGYLVEPNRIDEYTKKIISLLRDTALWEKYSLRAIEAARINCDVEIISRKWQQNLQDVVSQASGINTKKVMN